MSKLAEQKIRIIPNINVDTQNVLNVIKSVSAKLQDKNSVYVENIVVEILDSAATGDFSNLSIQDFLIPKLVSRLSKDTMLDTVSLKSALLENLLDSSTFLDIEDVKNSAVGNVSNFDQIYELVIRFESQKHVNLVWQQAIKISKWQPKYEVGDLLGWGWQGLRFALRRFDPQRGYCFSTYACTRINGTMRDGIREETMIPKRLQTDINIFKATKARVSQATGTSVTNEAIINMLGFSKKFSSTLNILSEPKHIHDLPEDSLDRLLHKSYATVDPADAVVAKNRGEKVLKLISALPEEDKGIIYLSILESATYADIKNALGIEPEVARLRKKEILASLRRELEDWE